MRNLVSDLSVKSVKTMKQKMYGALAVLSLLVALSVSNSQIVSFAALLVFMYSCNKAGVVNYMDEIWKED